MTSSLAVDIVVNNFNYARFLGAAIDSALAQSHDPVRVIVVDDGSTDESRAVIEPYGERVTAVFKPNGGQASAFNTGFAECSGDVVIFLDADDLLHPDAAARAAAAMAGGRTVAKVQYRMDVIDAEGRPTGEMKPPRHMRMPSGDVRHLELSAPFDLAWLPTSANAFAAWGLRRILPVPEAEFPSCADFYLKHLTALLGEVVSLEDVLASSRLHGANSYEPSDARIDVAHLRSTITYTAATRRHLEAMARQLGLHRDRRGGILSVADQADRLISLRLEPHEHPIRGDSVPMLAVGGVRAAWRRSDVSPAMRAGFALWFALAAPAPRRQFRWLAEQFLFHERRPSAVNALLRALHRVVR